MRVLAEEVTAEAKTIMLQLAEECDKLADRAKKRRRKNAKTAKG
jgi:hypothetical protein